MRNFSQQNGATLITGMMFLVLITLVAVTAMRMGMGQVDIQANALFRAEAMQAAQSAIDVNVGTEATFYAPITRVIDVTGDGVGDYRIETSVRCMSALGSNKLDMNLPKSCVFSTDDGSVAVCYDALFEFEARIDDPATGTRMTVVNGIKRYADMDRVFRQFNCFS